MQRRGIKAKTTIRQQNAINGILEAIYAHNPKSIIQIFKDAGYADCSAKQYSNIMESIRPHLQSALDWMELHRVRIMCAMDEKVGGATYAELARALDVLTRNHQLLGGKPTHNLAISAVDRSRLDALIDD